MYCLRFFIFTLPLFLSAHPLQIFTRSLSEYFYVDEESALAISQQLSSYLTNISEELINDLLTLGKEIKLTPPQSQTFHELANTDATIKAPRFHQIIFENEYLRILKAIVGSGETVPFHSHQWDRIVLTLEGATFTTQDGNNISQEECFPSVEYSEGSFKLYSYKNIGLTRFQGIIFEFKK